MKLRLDEYYAIISEEWEEIENYMPEDMAEELNFQEIVTQAAEKKTQWIESKVCPKLLETIGM